MFNKKVHVDKKRVIVHEGGWEGFKECLKFVHVVYGRP